MGGSSNPRGCARARNPESLPVSNGVSQPLPKKKWSNLLPLFMAFVVIAEIAFLGRLDMAKNVAIVDSWTDLLYKSKPLGLASERDDLGFILPLPEPEPEMETDRNFASESESCEEWLEREDTVSYSRDFKKDPILVAGDEYQGWKQCSVGCKFGSTPGKKPDAGFNKPGAKTGTAVVHRSMESSHYYPSNDVAVARRKGFDIVMTTSLSSDIPVGYFSWAEYDIMAPVQPKTEKALAAAFISNCGALNFRLEALLRLEQANIQIDSYGGCHNNRDGDVRKVDTLKRYKFSLAFENSNEEDYVTEKFFQSLVAGTIPVVVGAPNIQDFAPAPGSVLLIKELNDVESVAKTMKYLDRDSVAFNQSIRWKYEGPSDSFKALLDMAAVHSSCRLCIYLATTIRDKEDKSLKKRPCKCTKGSDTVYHLYVRERGRFEMQSIFLRSGSVTLEALESAVLSKFTSLNHVPVWKTERPESLRGGNELKIYRIYPVGMTQRQALYTFRFKGNADLKRHIETNPCAKFEVVFV